MKRVYVTNQVAYTDPNPAKRAYLPSFSAPLDKGVGTLDSAFYVCCDSRALVHYMCRFHGIAI